MIESGDIIILTNCFGHLYDIDLVETKLKDKVVIYDNAASPYSFFKGKNSCNYGTGSLYLYIILNQLVSVRVVVIIDKEYEEFVRAAVNFGMEEGVFNENGGNYKISEISAAGILQWWDQFNIDELASNIYRDNYYKARYEMRDV